MQIAQDLIEANDEWGVGESLRSHLNDYSNKADGPLKELKETVAKASEYKYTREPLKTKKRKTLSETLASILWDVLCMTDKPPTDKSKTTYRLAKAIRNLEDLQGLNAKIIQMSNLALQDGPWPDMLNAIFADYPSLYPAIFAQEVVNAEAATKL